MKSDYFWKFFTRLIIAFVFVTCVDGCVYRDPCVRLPYGYSILAISYSFPCHLNYSRHYDPRKYSKASGIIDEKPDGTQEYVFFDSDGRLIRYDSADEWREAMLEANAEPDSMIPDLKDVTAYRTDEKHLIGKNGDEWFLIGYKNHSYSSWDKKTEWLNEVKRSTSLSPDHLRDPKGILNQHRFPGTGVVYSIIVIICLLWANRLPIDFVE